MLPPCVSPVPSRKAPRRGQNPGSRFQYGLLSSEVGQDQEQVCPAPVTWAACPDLGTLPPPPRSHGRL